MSPFTLTMLLDEASLLAFAFVAGGLGAGQLARRRWPTAAVLLGAAGLTAAGVVPVLARLVAGQWLSDALPGLAIAQVTPWAALGLLVLLRPAPGPRDVRMDATSLAGLTLAVQGVVGLFLGLALLAQRWLARGPVRARVLVAVALLAAASWLAGHPHGLRDALGRWLGLSMDAQIWTTHLVVSLGELTGWVGLGTHVLAWAPADQESLSEPSSCSAPATTVT